MEYGVRRGADAERSSGTRLPKKGEEGETECSENVVVGESMPSGFGDEDFQPKKEENLDVGLLVLFDGDELDPNELSEIDLGRPPC